VVTVVVEEITVVLAVVEKFITELLTFVVEDITEVVAVVLKAVT
jgi:hypothetical protein